MIEKCEIIQDLIPLYIDHVCSSESEKAICEHVVLCKNCRDMMNSMIVPICNEGKNVEAKKIFIAKKMEICFIFIMALFLVVFDSINWNYYFNQEKIVYFNLIASIGFLLFWSIFIVKTKNYMNIMHIVEIMSVLTAVSSIISCVTNNSGGNSLVLKLICAISAIPFLGLEKIFNLLTANIICLVLTIGSACFCRYRILKIKNEYFKKSL